MSPANPDAPPARGEHTEENQTGNPDAPPGTGSSAQKGNQTGVGPPSPDPTQHRKQPTEAAGKESRKGGRRQAVPVAGLRSKSYRELFSITEKTRTAQTGPQTFVKETPMASRRVQRRSPSLTAGNGETVCFVQSL